MSPNKERGKVMLLNYVTKRWQTILKKSEYVGVMILQATGAWTRVGPTWRLPDRGWVTVGPGVHSWNTAEGLAQLAVDPTVRPKWHAIGGSPCDLPNLLFMVVDAVVEAHDDIKTLAADAEKWIEE